MYEKIFMINAVGAGVGAVVTLAVLPSPINYIAAMLLLMVAALNYKIYTKVRTKLAGKKTEARKTWALLLFITLMLLPAFAPVVAAQSPEEDCDPQCLTYRSALIGLESFIIYLAGFFTFMAIAPVIFARSPLGVIFSDFASLFVMGIVATYILIMFLVPIHVVYQTCDLDADGTPDGCYMDACALYTNGPIMIQLFYDYLISKISPTACTGGGGGGGGGW